MAKGAEIHLPFPRKLCRVDDVSLSALRQGKLRLGARDVRAARTMTLLAGDPSTSFVLLKRLSGGGSDSKYVV